MLSKIKPGGKRQTSYDFIYTCSLKTKQNKQQHTHRNREVTGGQRAVAGGKTGEGDKEAQHLTHSVSRGDEGKAQGIQSIVL